MDHLSNMPIDEQIEKHSNFKDRKFKKIILDDYNRFVFPDKNFAKSKSTAKSKVSVKSNVSAKSKVSGEGEGEGEGVEAALLTTLSENEEMVEVGVDSADNNLFDIDPILKPQFIHAVVSAANVTDSDFAHIIALNHMDMENQVHHDADYTNSHHDDDDDDDEEEEDGHSGPVFSNELVEDSYIIHDDSVNNEKQVKEPKEKLGKEKVVKEKLVKENAVKEKVVKEKPVKVPKEKVVKEKVVKVPKEKVVKEKVVKEKVVKEKVVKVPKEKVVKVPKEKVVKEKPVKVPKEKVVKEKPVRGKKKVADGPVVDVEVVDVAAHTVELAHV